MMLFRSVSKHVKEQNWFAVFIDFLIVVVGVFIGLQVNNWNTVNSERASERQLLLQIQSDVVAAVTLKAKWLEDMGTHRVLLLKATDIIQNNPEQQTISNPLCRAMWTSHLLFYPVAPLNSINELLAKGSLNTALGRSLRPALLRYRDHYEVLSQLSTQLSGLANLADTYGEAFPHRIVQKPSLANRSDEIDGEKVVRITNSTFETTCKPELIRANQTIQNKLLSNLARTDGVLQRVKIELSILKQIETDLMDGEK